MTNIIKKSNLPKRRRLASIEGCKNDLNEDLKKMFIAFNEALDKYQLEISQTPPEARARAFEASLLNSKMIASIQKHFPSNWKYAKYKRFILRKNGYQILFKKLNSSDKPMNIKTKTVSAISEQLSLPLFNNDSFIEEPILIFGYRKNKYGEIIDPKLVYIDENEVKFIIDKNDIDEGNNGSIFDITPDIVPVNPTVKKSAIKKAVNN